MSLSQVPWLASVVFKDPKSNTLLLCISSPHTLISRISHVLWKCRRKVDPPVFINVCYQHAHRGVSLPLPGFTSPNHSLPVQVQHLTLLKYSSFWVQLKHQAGTLPGRDEQLQLWRRRTRMVPLERAPLENSARRQTIAGVALCPPLATPVKPRIELPIQRGRLDAVHSQHLTHDQ